jgi:hypothetical protein
MLLNILDECPLDQALVEQRGERIPRINELGTTCPSPRPVNSLFGRVPKSHFVHLCGLILHDLALESHVAEEIQASRLDTIRSSCGCGFGAVVDVLDLVTPP